MQYQLPVELVNDKTKPAYSTPGSVGMDIAVAVTTVVPPNLYFAGLSNILRHIVKDDITPTDILADINRLEEARYLRHMVPLNIKVEYPKGYWGLLIPRGSLFKEKGLIQANSVGIIDNDFCKQHWIPVINMTNKDVILKAGELIAQLIILPYQQFEVIDSVVKQHEGHNGDGSSGGYKK